ncbi:DinB family protein [Paludisphaera rhizosphaerae]|uniref:DinB family protein n=1 Tax=Paludisphaera rhizosphaerae TaxID=2711216 RepID=UPI0013EA2F26|nr:DinB family protein [Paludisphaera rhizosphaerae]
MSQILADRFRRWFTYENEVHEWTLAAIESVPADRRDSPEYRRAVDLMAHLNEARGIWKRRIEGTSRPNENTFPPGRTLEEVKTAWAETASDWSAFLEALDDEGLARVVDYRTLDGSPFRNTVEELLTQLFGHSFYHRGQIAMLVKAAGGTPAMTDYVYWLRK